MHDKTRAKYKKKKYIYLVTRPIRRARIDKNIFKCNKNVFKFYLYL